ncbi:MAG: 5'-nucleotidase C-terminal domain-containing protein [Bacteroidetes bacterium]|nr:5'-nucleotidase C-terminal domain-containing protein [Bacteroidota bacterium]MCH8523742.1 5'-nucleotidase C-terminal domain-containing protein [Balneolales bacterium]
MSQSSYRLLMPARFAGFVLAVLFLSAACSTPEYALQLESATDEYLQIDGSLPDDPEMARLIAPFVTEMGARMNTVIAHSETPITRGRPEGTLNNLSADILRSRAVRELRHPVDIGVANFGGLRAPLPQGDITVGNIYELMPFENTIAVLRLTGEQVQIMANQIAVRRGEPVSGIRFRIEDGRAVDILVGPEPLRRDRYYWVATNSFVADGGDGIGVFLEAQERIDLPVLIRDAMIEYIRHRRHLNYELEGRIRFTED